MTKVLATGQSGQVAPGDVVVFTIEVTNQGLVNAQQIEITDYILAGLSFVIHANNTAAGWTAVGQTATTTYMPTIAAGSSASVNIELTVDGSVASNATLTNVAEISQAQDLAGNINPVDVDSNPDAINAVSYTHLTLPTKA